VISHLSQATNWRKRPLVTVNMADQAGRKLILTALLPVKTRFTDVSYLPKRFRSDKRAHLENIVGEVAAKLHGVKSSIVFYLKISKLNLFRLNT
jgi:hypothetical protein